METSATGKSAVERRSAYFSLYFDRVPACQCITSSCIICIQTLWPIFVAGTCALSAMTGRLTGRRFVLLVSLSRSLRVHQQPSSSLKHTSIVRTASSSPFPFSFSFTVPWRSEYVARQQSALCGAGR